MRPAALLLGGAAVALHGHLPAIRRRVAAVDEAWRTSTSVGGTASLDGVGERSSGARAPLE